ncbi:hypothetical protein [Antarcticirhabdus aurantiaca]|uniref:hypothetical protein n=1 Tax=Antarcticirhabdus aurantiaca TaxID=2606717 RepID=UPI00131AE2F6|nr:hypothetical protein [Antarcticirhabdus aurantiaca]
MGRLLSAVLLCLSVVLSQMAHAAPAPAAPHDATTVQAAHVDGSAEASHDAHSHAGKAEHPSADDDHSGPSDMKCASHCPSLFVPGTVPGALLGRAGSDVVALAPGSLKGLPAGTTDRPPRT